MANFVVMKTKLLFVLFALISFFAESQILIDHNVQLGLIPEMFLGEGFEISNVTFSGDENQIGLFFENNSNLGIDIGTVIGTGNVNYASGATNADPDSPGPGGNSNNSGSLGGGNFGASDDDLETISGAIINDVAVLDTIKTKYD